MKIFLQIAAALALIYTLVNISGHGSGIFKRE